MTHEYDHDGTARHHHDVDTGDPLWWGQCEQFGGEKRPHRHDARAALASAESGDELPIADFADKDGARFKFEAAKRALAAAQPEPGLREALRAWLDAPGDDDDAEATLIEAAKEYLDAASPQPTGEPATEDRDHHPDQIGVSNLYARYPRRCAVCGEPWPCDANRRWAETRKAGEPR